VKEIISNGLQKVKLQPLPQAILCEYVTGFSRGYGILAVLNHKVIGARDLKSYVCNRLLQMNSMKRRPGDFCFPDK